MIEHFGSRKFKSLKRYTGKFPFLDNSDRAGHLSLSRSKGCSYTKFSLGLKAGANFYLDHWEPFRSYIRRLIGTSEHSVSIIEFDLGMIELHARNCSMAY